MNELEDKIDPYIITEINSDQYRHEVLFRASLSDGTMVYSRDGRRSWLELKEFLKGGDLYITSLCISFRDNFICLPEDKDGYFFSHGVQCWNGGPTQNTLIVGYVQDNILIRDKYLSPELVHNGSDCFSVNHANMQKGLIWKKSSKVDTAQEI